MSEREATIERLREKAATEELADPEGDGGGVDSELPLETEEKKSSTREYVVLGSWKEAARVEADTPRAALETLGKLDGEYAVVPSRYWSPFGIKTEQTTVTQITPLD